MLYAQLKDWPDGYEEVKYLADILRQYDMMYRVHVELKMFHLRNGVEPEHIVVIVRWEGSGGGMRRTEMATFDDISEATGMLRLLIGNAKEMRG